MNLASDPLLNFSRVIRLISLTRIEKLIIKRNLEGILLNFLFEKRLRYMYLIIYSEIYKLYKNSNITCL